MVDHMTTEDNSSSATSNMNAAASKITDEAPLVEPRR